MSKRVFISYEHDGDRDFINGIRGMIANDNIDLDFYDESVRDAIDSRNADYIKSKIKEKILRSSILLVIVGKDTHTSRWVLWEIETARNNYKSVIFMRRKNDFSSSLSDNFTKGRQIHNWDVDFLISATR